MVKIEGEDCRFWCWWRKQNGVLGLSNLMKIKMTDLVSRLTRSRWGAVEHLSDLELARRSLSGDSDAYRVLYERSYRRVYGVVARLANRREDVEDVVQDAFVRGYEMLSQYSGKSSFSTWICAVALNLMKSRLGKLARERPLPLDVDEADGAAARLEEVVAEHDLLTRALLNLPKHYQEVLVLRFFEELSYREIAEELGCPIGTVGTRVHVAVKALCAEIAKLEDEANGLQ